MSAKRRSPVNAVVAAVVLASAWGCGTEPDGGAGVDPPATTSTVPETVPPTVPETVPPTVPETVPESVPPTVPETVASGSDEQAIVPGVYFVLPDEAHPFEDLGLPSEPGQPPFVVAVERFALAECCRGAIVVQNQDPRLFEPAIISEWTTDGFQWTLEDVGPRDRSSLYAVTLVTDDEGEPLAVAVGVSIVNAKFTPTDVDIEGFVRELVGAIRFDEGVVPR